MAFRVVHYINQFFANVGGEEMAHIAPELREGKVGPGAAFETAWKGEAVIVNTIVCGDSFFAEHEKEAKETVVNWVKEIKPDMFIAGPAFNAGRYGYACANIALEVKTQLGIPVLTGMYEENPGADLKDKILITPTANSAAGMRKAAPTMAALSLKLMKGEKLGASCEDGYMPNGIRVNFFEKERGAKRAVKMLLNKINGKPFGFNIGYGFGNTSAATENVIFYDGKAHKFGAVDVETFPKPDKYMEPWHFVSEDGRFDMTMKPFYDHHSDINALVMRMHSHQVHGLWSGTCTLDDGTVLHIEDMYAFCEYVENRW